MSENKRQTNNKQKELTESDTDNENDNENINTKNTNPSISNKNNSKGNNLVFNQSNQNFAKFSQMAKNNNQSSFSDHSLSKEENFDEDDNISNEEERDIITEMKQNKDISKGKKKSETPNSDIENKNSKKNQDYNSESINDENEDSVEDYNNRYKYYNNNEKENDTQKLTFYDLEQFGDLNLDNEGKSLLNVMKKFQPDNNILRLDTKIKPFIPNFIPSIGEVDAFIKLNRPDNKIEELGLDLIDEPTYNGIDPSVFSLELSYKLKSHIPENFIIKNISLIVGFTYRGLAVYK